MKNEEKCIFCQIVEGKEEANVRYENDNFIVFDDINPKAPEHVLIVPREHIEDMGQTDETTLSEMLMLAKKISNDWQLDHFRVQINNGRKAGQIVDHLHMHLLGWNKGKEVA